MPQMGALLRRTTVTAMLAGALLMAAPSTTFATEPTDAISDYAAMMLAFGANDAAVAAVAARTNELMDAADIRTSINSQAEEAVEALTGRPPVTPAQAQSDLLGALAASSAPYVPDPGLSAGANARLAEVVNSADYELVRQKLIALVQTPEFAGAYAAVLNALPTLSVTIGLGDAIKSIVKQVTSLAVGAVIGAACVPPVAIATCAPAILIGVTILVVQDVAFDQVDVLESQVKSYNTSTLTCSARGTTGLACLGQGTATSSNVLIRDVYTSMIFENNPLSPQSSTSITTTTGWQQQSTNPNRWAVTGYADHPFARPYRTIRYYVFLTWTDGTSIKENSAWANAVA